MNPIIITIIATALVLLLMLITLYNRLKVRRNQIENATSSLDALFIKRSELIPNLVAIVKQYVQYESNLLNEIVSKRNAATQPYQQDGEAIEAMRTLMIQAENYPELKAHTQFTNLQYSWNEAEEQISAGRRYLSTSITQFNDALNTSPGNIVAAMFGIRKHEWQYATAQQRSSPDAAQLFQ